VSHSCTGFTELKTSDDSRLPVDSGQGHWGTTCVSTTLTILSKRNPTVWFPCQILVCGLYGHGLLMASHKITGEQRQSDTAPCPHWRAIQSQKTNIGIYYCNQTPPRPGTVIITRLTAATDPTTPDSARSNGAPSREEETGWFCETT
jgi:hypothetical protein